MTLSLDRLRQLIAVADHGSFSQAAVHLHLSQPALSRNIASLEQRYGFRIFNRIGHGVSLTSTGEQVLAQARRLLQDLKLFESNMRLFGAGETGELSVGFGPLLASLVLPRLAATLFTASPRIRLRTLIRPGPVLAEALRSDRIELFFCPAGMMTFEDDIAVSDIGTLSPGFFIRAGHPLAAQPICDVADLARFPHASAIERVEGERVEGERMEMGQAIAPARGEFLCDNYHVLREAVLASDMIMVGTHHFAAKDVAEGRLVALNLPAMKLPQSAILMVHLRNRTLSPLARRAAEVMAEVLGTT